MATLLFFDESHQYTLNGEEIPSVSEISRFASREIYGTVQQYNLDNACKRGSSVHKATEVLDKYNEVECEPEVEQYIRAYIKFRKDYGIKDYECIEKALASENLKYAGTIDRLIYINENFAKVYKQQTKLDITDSIGKFAILDLKSSSSLQKVLAQIQLNAYKKLVEENQLGEVAVLAIIHLNKNGDYKVHNFEIDDKLFMSCYNLHKALEKKKRIKIVQEGK